jgi:hypothetical protein
MPRCCLLRTWLVGTVRIVPIAADVRSIRARHPVSRTSIVWATFKGTIGIGIVSSHSGPIWTGMEILGTRVSILNGHDRTRFKGTGRLVDVATDRGDAVGTDQEIFRTRVGGTVLEGTVGMIKVVADGRSVGATCQFLGATVHRTGLERAVALGRVAADVRAVGARSPIAGAPVTAETVRVGGGSTTLCDRYCHSDKKQKKDGAENVVHHDPQYNFGKKERESNATNNTAPTRYFRGFADPKSELRHRVEFVMAARRRWLIGIYDP